MFYRTRFSSWIKAACNAKAVMDRIIRASYVSDKQAWICDDNFFVPRKKDEIKASVTLLS